MGQIQRTQDQWLAQESDIEGNALEVPRASLGSTANPSEQEEKTNKKTKNSLRINARTEKQEQREKSTEWKAMEYVSWKKNYTKCTPSVHEIHKVSLTLSSHFKDRKAEVWSILLTFPDKQGRVNIWTWVFCFKHRACDCAQALCDRRESAPSSWGRFKSLVGFSRMSHLLRCPPGQHQSSSAGPWRKCVAQNSQSSSCSSHLHSAQGAAHVQQFNFSVNGLINNFKRRSRKGSFFFKENLKTVMCLKNRTCKNKNPED